MKYMVKYQRFDVEIVPVEVGGLSWIEAKREVVTFYKDLIYYWENKDEPKYRDNASR